MEKKAHLVHLPVPVRSGSTGSSKEVDRFFVHLKAGLLLPAFFYDNLSRYYFSHVSFINTIFK